MKEKKMFTSLCFPLLLVILIVIRFCVQLKFIDIFLLRAVVLFREQEYLRQSVWPSCFKQIWQDFFWLNQMSMNWEKLLDKVLMGKNCVHHEEKQIDEKMFDHIDVFSKVEMRLPMKLWQSKKWVCYVRVMVYRRRLFVKLHYWNVLAKWIVII